MNAVAFAALASMLFGTADFLGGLASRKAPALVVTLIAMLAGFVLLLPAAAGAGGSPGIADYAWSVAAGVFGGLGVALLFHVLARGPVGAVAPIVAVCGVAMPAVSGLLFGEQPGAWPITGIALAAVAVVLVSGGEHPGSQTDAKAHASTLMLSAVAGFGLGAFLVCISRVPATAGLWPLVVARLAGLVAVVIVMVFRHVPLAGARAAWGGSAISGLTDAAANLLFLWIVRQHPLSIVGTIVSLSPATVVLLARVVLRERFHRRQVAGLALAGAAIVLMTFKRG